MSPMKMVVGLLEICYAVYFSKITFPHEFCFVIFSSLDGSDETEFPLLLRKRKAIDSEECNIKEEDGLEYLAGRQTVPLIAGLGQWPINLLL